MELRVTTKTHAPLWMCVWKAHAWAMQCPVRMTVIPVPLQRDAMLRRESASGFQFPRGRRATMGMIAQKMTNALRGNARARRKWSARMKTRARTTRAVLKEAALFSPIMTSVMMGTSAPLMMFVPREPVMVRCWIATMGILAAVMVVIPKQGARRLPWWLPARMAIPVL